jgi:hypothetical protein
MAQFSQAMVTEFLTQQRELIMFVLATGTFTDPSKLGPYLNEEIAQIHANRDKGLIVRRGRAVNLH